MITLYTLNTSIFICQLSILKYYVSSTLTIGKSVLSLFEGDLFVLLYFYFCFLTSGYFLKSVLFFLGFSEFSLRCTLAFLFLPPLFNLSHSLFGLL